MNGLFSTHTFRLIICASLLLVLHYSIGQATATGTDADAPLQVEAGRFEAYQAENVSIFRDNVLITKGSIRIKATEARLQVIDGEVKQATIVGNPVEFEQRDKNGELIRGWADRIEYNADTGQVDLTGNAKLYQGEDVFESETIHYDTLNQRVHAQSDQASAERVQITFMPRNRKTATDNDQTQEETLRPGDSNDSEPAADNP